MKFRRIDIPKLSKRIYLHKNVGIRNSTSATLGIYSHIL